MRYSPTLDRILYSISLLREGKTMASAAMLAEAMDDPGFEEDFIALNQLQGLAHSATASIEDQDPQDDGDGGDDDRLLSCNTLDGECAGGQQDGWDDVGSDECTAGSSGGDGRPEPQLETAGSHSDNIRRTTMMLRNLQTLRGG